MMQKDVARVVGGRGRSGALGDGLHVPAVLTLLVAADIMLCALFANGGASKWLGFVVHCGMVGAAAQQVLGRRGDDCTMSVIGLLFILLAGPLGAVALAILLVIVEQASLPQGLLDDWYKRISGDGVVDPAGLIHDGMLNDRAFRPGSGEIRRLGDVFRRGTVPEKQALLGLIGLRYHADYFPFLGLGLRAGEASVRTQAAAVFVKLKEQFKARMKQAVVDDVQTTDSNAAVAPMLDRVRTILDCTQSGFIDAAEAAHARATAKALCERALAADPTNTAAETLLCRALAADGAHESLVARLIARPTVTGRELDPLLADSLMALGRHRELRELLKTMVMSSVRPMGLPSISPSVAVCS